MYFISTKSFDTQRILSLETSVSKIIDSLDVQDEEAKIYLERHLEVFRRVIAINQPGKF